MTPRTIAPHQGIRLRLRRRFPRSPEAVFRAWTDPETLRRWWCPPGWAPAEMEVDLRTGGAYRLGMRPLAGGTPVYVRGRFLEISEPDKLIYTWKWENAFEQMPETCVTVRFIGSSDSTEMELTHEPLSEVTLCLRHRSGWVEAWQRLQDIL